MRIQKRCCSSAISAASQLGCGERAGGASGSLEANRRPTGGGSKSSGRLLESGRRRPVIVVLAR